MLTLYIGAEKKYPYQRSTLAVRQQLLLWDERAVIRLACRRSVPMDFVMRGATRIGDGHVWALLALVLWQVNGVTVFLQLALAYGVEFSVYTIMKRSFSRPRPFTALPEVPRGIQPPDEFSFPSGHTASAFVFATVVGAAMSGLLVPLMILAMCIGVSRVYLGVHYPSDVIAGAGLGIVAGWLAILLL